MHEVHILNFNAAGFWKVERGSGDSCKTGSHKRAEMVIRCKC